MSSASTLAYEVRGIRFRPKGALGRWDWVATLALDRKAAATLMVKGDRMCAQFHSRAHLEHFLGHVAMEHPDMKESEATEHELAVLCSEAYALQRARSAGARHAVYSVYDAKDGRSFYRLTGGPPSAAHEGLLRLAYGRRFEQLIKPQTPLESRAC